MRRILARFLTATTTAAYTVRTIDGVAHLFAPGNREVGKFRTADAAERTARREYGATVVVVA